MFGEKLIKICYIGSMVLFKRFICASIALSFFFAGFPVMAKPMPCPMEKAQMEMQMSGMNCDQCPEMQKQTDTSGKNGCCDDAACNVKCMTGASSAKVPPVAGIKWTATEPGNRMEALSDSFLPSLRGKTPEKPPKYLS